MSAFRKVADIAHKTTVTGLFGFFGYGLYGITNQVLEHQGFKDSHPQEGFIQMLRDKCAEEYAKYYDIGHRDWYDKNDDSYLKKLPRPEDYQGKK
mmetsp:Transcript_8715/g.11684  ORF Transcript_8715/g.11684 Transcript_8715/m.11684 type:complete len:95 (-) Transcript_8715:91-375(-)